MSIRTRLQLTAVIVLGAVGIILLTVFITSRLMDANLIKSQQYAEVTRKVSDLNVLASEYLANPNERTKEQAQAVNRSLGILLNEIQPQDIEEKARIDTLRKDYLELNFYLSQLLATEGSTSEEYKERIESLLSVKFNAMIDEISRSAEESQVKAIQSQQRTSLITIGIVIAMLVLSGIVLFAASKTITESIRKLYKGTVSISSGNYDQKIEITGADEVAKLAGSFNIMAQQIAQNIMELRAAADEISESRRQVIDILESVTDAFYALDNDWRFTYVNHRAEELFGIRREQLLFRNIWNVIRKEQSPEIFKNYHQAKEELTPVVFEDYSRRLNKWLEMHVYPYQNGVSVYIKDVSDRKQAEKEKLASLHFFESMDRINRAIQTSNDLEQMMKDTLDTVLSILDSDRAYLLYPCDPESPFWSIPMERTKPEYPSLLEKGAEIPMDSEDSRVFRLLLEARGPLMFGPGAKYPLPVETAKRYGFQSFIAMAVFPKIGKPWIFGIHQSSYPRIWTDEEVNLFREIGRRIADGLSSLIINRNLQESEARYRRIIDTSNEGIWLLGPDTKITSVNARMAEILGYKIDEMIGKFVTDFMFEEDISSCLEKVENRRRGIAEHFESRYRRKDGQIVWVLVAATPIFDSEHRYQGAFAMFTDITERKLEEEHRREFYRLTILAATDGKLQLTEREEIERIAGPPAVMFPATNAEEFRNVRNTVMEIALSLGIDELRAGDYRAAIGEAVTNAIKHAGGGTVSVHVLAEAIFTVISDNGPGIEAMSIPRVALEKGYTTAGTLGMGYKVILSIADKVYLATGSWGTTVGMEMSIKPVGTTLDISAMYHTL